MRRQRAKSSLRQCQASAWLTEIEYDKISKLAEEHGTSVSSFCRNLLISVITEKEKQDQIGKA